jgi:Na+/H+ antiporter NhaD/arsenite permease-like protein
LRGPSPSRARATPDRALLGTHLALHGSFASQLADGAALASAASNLPAAAATVPGMPSALWAAILAIAIGPDIIITGSVASLIARRIARDSGTQLSAWQFSAVGIVLVPLQLAAATLGLHVTGGLS